MSLLHLIVAIVTILVYVFCKDHLGTPIGWKQKSSQNEKEKDYRSHSSVRAPDSLKRRRKSKEMSRRPAGVGSSFFPDWNFQQKSEIEIAEVADSDRPEWVASAFPRHKTDPRIFVDEEEIGQEPIV